MFCALLVKGDIMKTNVELISTRVYAGRLKDRENLNNSSSGGAFTALSDFFLKNGNAVIVSIYNCENHTTEFQMILDKDQREREKCQNICRVNQTAFSGKPIAG